MIWTFVKKISIDHVPIYVKDTSKVIKDTTVINKNCTSKDKKEIVANDKF